MPISLQGSNLTLVLSKPYTVTIPLVLARMLLQSCVHMCKLMLFCMLFYIGYRFLLFVFIFGIVLYCFIVRLYYLVSND